MSLVCFAFGVAAVQAGEPLAGPVLVRLLADLGLSESAARSLLLRMRREGLLASERAGREAKYRLAPAVSAAQARIEGQLRGQRPAWTGSFSGVLYEIPERQRAYRDLLRRTAQLLGYATLHPGLLVATTDRWEDLVSMLPGPPAGSQLLRTRLTLCAEDSRRVAATLWALEAQADRYRAALSEARARTDLAERRPPSAATALRAFAATTLPLYEAGADDPDLPAELLSPDWPGDQVGATLSRAFRVFAPLLGEYLAELTRKSPAQ